MGYFIFDLWDIQPRIVVQCFANFFPLHWHEVFLYLLQKAPVLARAAMLLECCHLVHLCNKGDWDCCSRPEFATKKDLAMTLYKWGTTIGEKLAAILKQESEDGNDWLEETASVEAIEKSTLNESNVILNGYLF